MMQHVRPTLVADIISAGAIIGVFAHVIPWLGGLAAFVWYCVQILESKTVQCFFRKRRHRKMRRQRAHRRVQHRP